MLTVAA